MVKSSLLCMAFTAVLSIVWMSGWAGSPVPESMKIYPDLGGHWFLDGKLNFGCEVQYTNGGKRKTTGYLNGNLPWGELYCECNQGIIHGDELLVDLYKVRQNKGVVQIHARHRDYPKVEATFEIKIPPLTLIELYLSENDLPRYGSTVEPIIHLEWANGTGYSYKASNRESLVSPDSIALYFNSTPIESGKVQLPAFSMNEPHSFSLSAVWISKPWLHDVETFAYIGKEHRTWRFPAASGANARRQAMAPKGMDGAEGYHGSPGADADSIHIRLSLSPDKKRIVVSASNGKRAYTRDFALEEFSLEIVARGGNGGNGGRGGEGGAAPFEDPNKAGIGGKGGRGGRGGKGAPVGITSTPETEAFIPCIIIDNADGLPGKPGAGGKGGIFSNGYRMPTLVEMIFPSRNYDGEPGDN